LTSDSCLIGEQCGICASEYRLVSIRQCSEIVHGIRAGHENPIRIEGG